VGVVSTLGIRHLISQAIGPREHRFVGWGL